MSARLSLAQQLAQLDEPAPVDFDPEDVQISGIDPSDLDQQPDSNAREHYVQVGTSAIRKLHDTIADPKYDGIRTTRTQLMGQSSTDGLDSDEDVQEDGHEEAHIQYPGSQSSDEEQTSSSNVGQEVNHTQAPIQTPISQDLAEDLPSTLRKTRDEDHKKGKAVARQIAVWDTLLDARIRLQKSVTAANRLPEPSLLPKFASSPDARELLDNLLSEALSLTDELCQFQETLLTTNESITPPPRKKRKISPGTESTWDEELSSATEAASSLEYTLHSHLITTLLKWSSKIQAVAPSVLLPSNRNAFSNSKNVPKSVVQLIDETLVDSDKLLKRTQTRRGNGLRIGDTRQEDNEKEKIDAEIFDDADFYQQLLRDVIDARGNSSNDDWMILQKQKKAQKKKTIDTKASKGRKIRYQVHEKLQNFMVPVPVQQGAWHDEQIDELFASLLGKGFEGIEAEAHEVDARMREQDIGEALKDGFRVFG